MLYIHFFALQERSAFYKTCLIPDPDFPSEAALGPKNIVYQRSETARHQVGPGRPAHQNLKSDNNFLKNIPHFSEKHTTFFQKAYNIFKKHSTFF